MQRTNYRAKTARYKLRALHKVKTTLLISSPHTHYSSPAASLSQTERFKFETLNPISPSRCHNAQPITTTTSPLHYHPYPFPLQFLRCLCSPLLQILSRPIKRPSLLSSHFHHPLQMDWSLLFTFLQGNPVSSRIPQFKWHICRFYPRPTRSVKDSQSKVQFFYWYCT